MSHLKVLLSAQGPEVKEALLASFNDEEISLELSHCHSVDDTLEALVTGDHAVCLVRSKSDLIQDAVSIAFGAKEAGLRTPILVLMDLANRHHERDLVRSGAIAAIPWDGSQSAMLRNIVRMTLIMHQTEEKLREANASLFQDLTTMKDLRERSEELNTEYVELAENHALAKAELEKINQEKNQFFSIISHDLRSPFTSLLGMTRMMSEKSDSFSKERLSGLAKKVNEAGEHVLDLLQNLLEWSRLQMEGVEQKPETFALRAIADECIGILTPVAQEKGISLINNIEKEKVHADKNTVLTVIRNLIANSIKFSSEGGAVEVTSRVNGELTQVTVTDSGVGIMDEQAKAIFTVGEKTSTLGTSGEKGTGLGLPLCKELLERNDGHIWVESTVGKGSKFHFTLPVEPGKI